MTYGSGGPPTLPAASGTHVRRGAATRIENARDAAVAAFAVCADVRVARRERPGVGRWPGRVDRLATASAQAHDAAVEWLCALVRPASARPRSLETKMVQRGTMSSARKQYG
jgi:hypothetical protein